MPESTGGVGGICIPPTCSRAKLAKKVLLFYYHLLLIILVLPNAQNDDDDDCEDEKLDEPNVNRRDGIAVV